MKGQHHFHLDIGSALEGIPIEQRKIDPVGIAEILSSGFLLGNRTLVQGVRRAPWMAALDMQGKWEFAALPQHGKQKLPMGAVVQKLKRALHREALSYVEGKRRVGILLSGGLDSRIVAGIIRELQLAHEFTGDIVALTWGLQESRDVIYAREIAQGYNWAWLHFPLGPEILLENIHIAGRLGAEFSPLHLHALPRVREIEGLDAILAGSYGDSVGRAEFSGRHVLQLKPVVPRVLNYLGLMPHKMVISVRSAVLHDAYEYRQRFPREEAWQYRELEQQMHYMRRKLQACMSYVAERIPLFQLFTSPECVSLMWSLDPSIRDNRYYEVLLPSLPGKVGSIPWARTGRPLGEPKGPTDKAPGLSHKYGVWLRRDLRTMITELAASDTIRELNLFNEQALNRLIRLWPRAQTTSTNRMDDIISWMASLAIFVKRYDIKPINTLSPSWRDGVNALSGVARAWAYQTVRGKLRR
jgi:asparagine synthase (glutamine-hydrolysing)